MDYSSVAFLTFQNHKSKLCTHLSGVIFQKYDPYDNNVYVVSDAGVAIERRDHVHDCENVCLDVAVLVELHHGRVCDQQGLNVTFLTYRPSPPGLPGFAATLHFHLSDLLLPFESSFHEAPWFCQTNATSQFDSFHNSRKTTVYNLYTVAELRWGTVWPTSRYCNIFKRGSEKIHSKSEKQELVSRLKARNIIVIP